MIGIHSTWQSDVTRIAIFLSFFFFLALVSLAFIKLHGIIKKYLPRTKTNNRRNRHVQDTIRYILKTCPFQAEFKTISDNKLLHHLFISAAPMKFESPKGNLKLRSNAQTIYPPPQKKMLAIIPGSYKQHCHLGSLEYWPTRHILDLKIVAYLLMDFDEKLSINTIYSIKLPGFLSELELLNLQTEITTRVFMVACVFG